MIVKTEDEIHLYNSLGVSSAVAVGMDAHGKAGSKGHSHKHDCIEISDTNRSMHSHL